MDPAPTPLTLRGFGEGARRTLPLLPGIVVFAAAYGAAAAQKGLSALEAVAASAFVYGGAAQMVALEIWPRTWSASAVLAIATVTAFVNARFVLMGATVEPWIRTASPLRRAAILSMLVDAGWLIATAYRTRGGRDLGVLVGANFAMWPPWVLFTGLGHAAGALVAEPRRFGLDLVMPIFFAAMLPSLWRGVGRALPWAVAGAVALVARHVLPGYLFIVAGAVAGILAGACLPRSDPPGGIVRPRGGGGDEP